MPIFEIKDLTYFYPESQRPALKDVNMSIEEGEFLLVTGGSGSGKSSLARVLAGLIPGFSGGRISGSVFFRGKDIEQIDRRTMAGEVGIVFQDPEKQLVKTSVEAEIAFGLENLGLPQQEMARRVAEVMSFLGLADLRREFTAKLSGGQKQKLALAAVLAMQPSVLILDEPTSQLDPVAAEDFLNVVKRLNEDMGLTVILIEQRLERCFHLADKVLIMEDGRIRFEGTPEQVARRAAFCENPFIPPVARFFGKVGFNTIPVTVKDGRRMLKQNFNPAPGNFSMSSSEGMHEREPLIRMEGVWFTYPDGREALQDINLEICAGELVAVIGPNGSGKSTLLKNMAGLLKPGRGRVIMMGNKQPKSATRTTWDPSVGYLSQNPNDYLFQDTVEEELLYTLKNFGIASNGAVDEIIEKLSLGDFRRVNPRDLSYGERQRVALASVLVTGPKLLLLDEPTKGLDYRLKSDLGEVLAEFCRQGAAVVLTTHDVEFAAKYASRVIMLFCGRVICDGPVHQVLSDSIFYSTQIGRMCRGFADGILTPEEALAVFKPALAKIIN
ncbi:ABC transporter related protein [Thermosediminibacter oceani DSM 16646]|uniref:ABC transporter related protein n=1 Tax=Thermosediminibacter oceani (strain ATCC BAA-1034 / DSM 16646 / JW/IW-1228P) TaxID=555079 RepID=D9S0W7_THEOJ|nr:ABC transporter ATP-binding protein [Thermosediminibacter oceani]ADL07131.1 ABC transporter related protein [Thermosediminibacter oceani DSM 16646]